MEKNINRYASGTVKIAENGYIFYADSGFYSLVGVERVENLNDFVWTGDQDNIVDALKELNEKHYSETIFRFVNPQGGFRWVLAQFSFSSRIMYGKRLVDVTISDIEDVNERVCKLEDRCDELSSMLDLMNSLLMSYDADTGNLRLYTSDKNNVTYFQGNFDRFVEDKIDNGCIYAEHLLIFEELCKDFKEGVPQFKVEFKAKLLGMEDDYVWYEVVGKTTKNENGYVKTFAKLEQKSEDNHGVDNSKVTYNTIDAGTGLVNKGTILSYAKSLINSKPDYNIALAIIDLDNFKNVNDTYGHRFGDEVLAKTASIIKDAVGELGVAGRIGGDEMLVILEHVENDAQLRGVLRTIRTNVEWSYQDIKSELEISCSIGAAVYPSDAQTFETLFELADKLLYLAKEKGRNRYIIYVPEIHDSYLSGKMKSSISMADRAFYSRTDIVNEVVGRALSHQGVPDDVLMDRIMKCFDLEDIAIINNDNKRIAGCSYLTNIVASHDYLLEEGYQDLFDSNSICVVSSLSYIEMWSQKAHDIFAKQNINSMIEYRYMVNDEIKGYVAFSKSKFTKKWTELDITLLTVLGRLMSYQYFD